MINELLEALDELSKVYRGPSQHTALKSILTAMVAGEPVLLIGPHGTFKSSMASFVGSAFEKRVAVIEADARSFADIESFFDSLAKELRQDRECLMENRVDGVDVEYKDYPEMVRVRAVVDLVKYPINADARVVSLKVFRAQVNEQMDPEDVLGYAVHHRALLGMKPPHVVRRGRLAGADYVVLDEAFAAPRLMSKLHTAVNEKLVDTAIGPAKISPLTFVFCTNPWNQFYQTNPKVVNAATLDRFLLSAEVLAPSSAEVLYTFKALKELEIRSRLPVDAVYAARRAADSVDIPGDIMRFCVGLVSALSTCYFSPVDGDVRGSPVSPFMVERDCTVCRYKNAVCALANLGKVRALISLKKVMAASAALSGRKEAEEADLEFALKTVLPHRLFFNDPQFVSIHGTIHSAAARVVSLYCSEIAQYRPLVEKIMRVSPGDWNEVLSLAGDVKDNVALRSILDDIITMMKESAEKQGKEVPKELRESMNLKEALEAFSLASVDKDEDGKDKKEEGGASA